MLIFIRTLVRSGIYRWFSHLIACVRGHIYRISVWCYAWWVLLWFYLVISNKKEKCRMGRSFFSPWRPHSPLRLNRDKGQVNRGLYGVSPRDAAASVLPPLWFTKRNRKQRREGSDRSSFMMRMQTISLTFYFFGLPFLSFFFPVQAAKAYIFLIKTHPVLWFITNVLWE